MVTHDPEFILRCCKFVIHMEHGKIQESYSLCEPEGRERLLRIFSERDGIGGKMKLHASGEDYLEAVLVLQKEKGMVRSVDVARHMEVSKPSVCHAVTTLKKAAS